MKHVLCISALVLLMTFQQSCSSTRKAEVVGKSTALDADFSHVKSYSWTSDIDRIPNDVIYLAPNGVYVFNNVSGRKMVKDAVQYELNARGYKMNEARPDILVSFFITERPGRLATTNGFVTVASGQKVREPGDIVYKDVKAGTLIINFTNASTGKMMWQGFASGILQPDQMNDASKIHEAVSSVFSQFKHNNIS